MDAPVPGGYGGESPAPACPYCCEAVRPGARKCPHCQEYLDPALAAERRPGPGVSALAVLSLVLGVVSPFLLFFPGPLAALLGAVALVRRRRGDGKGMAVAGLALGLLSTLALVLMLALIHAVAQQIGSPHAAPSPAEPLF